MFKFNPSSFTTTATTFKARVKKFTLDRYFSGIPQGAPVVRFISASDDCVVIGYSADATHCIVVDNTADDVRDCQWTLYFGNPKSVTQAIKDGWNIGRIERELCGDTEGCCATPDHVMTILKKHGPFTPKQVISDEDYCL